MNLSHGNGAANLKENSMRQAFGFLTYYAMRRTRGALARQWPARRTRMPQERLAPQKRPQTHTRHNSVPAQAEWETP